MATMMFAYEVSVLIECTRFYFSNEYDIIVYIGQLISFYAN